MKNTSKEPGRYRVMELGLDFGPVRSWRVTLTDIDASPIGDGAVSVWDDDEQRFLKYAEIDAAARTEAAARISRRRASRR